MKWDIPFGESSKTRAMRKQERRLPHQRPVKPSMPKRTPPEPGPPPQAKP